jgi:uncharacterized protein (TIGR02145 family)
MPKFAALLLLCTALFAQQKGTLTDTRDGKIYKTVKIGEQVWMAENLNFEAKGSTCYDNKPDNCKKYGRLYKLETAKTACPSGWHLPNDTDWDKLFLYIDGKKERETTEPYSKTAGKLLKSKSGWNENGNGNYASNNNILEWSWEGEVTGTTAITYKYDSDGFPTKQTNKTETEGNEFTETNLFTYCGTKN